MNKIVNRNTQPVYINSADRLDGTADNFTINIKDVSQTMELSRVSIVNIVIPFSYFSINAVNNVFVISEAAVVKSTTITPGNFSGPEIASFLSTAVFAPALANAYTFTFSPITGKLTMTRTAGAANFAVLGANALFTAEVPTGYILTTVEDANPKTSDNVINLSAPQVIKLHLSNFRRGYSSFIQNETDVVVNIPVNANRFESIIYNLPFELDYDFHNGFFNNIRLRLTDESNNSLNLNGLNWSIMFLLEASE